MVRRRRVRRHLADDADPSESSVSPALLVGVGCFLGTLGVALLAWLAADYENRRVGHRQFEYERRLQWRIDRSAEDRDYLALHSIASDYLSGPYDQQHPLNARLSETAVRVEPASGGRPTILAPVDAAAVSLSRVVPFHHYLDESDVAVMNEDAS